MISTKREKSATPSEAPNSNGLMKSLSGGMPSGALAEGILHHGGMRGNKDCFLYGDSSI